MTTIAPASAIPMTLAKFAVNDQSRLASTTNQSLRNAAARVGVDSLALRRIDANGDGNLTAEEVAARLERAPSAEVARLDARHQAWRQWAKVPVIAGQLIMSIAGIAALGVGTPAFVVMLGGAALMGLGMLMGSAFPGDMTRPMEVLALASRKRLDDAI